MSQFEEGPYLSPKCRVGTILHDEMLGDVKVVRIQAEPIKWPLCLAPQGQGRQSIPEFPVLCDDLVRAICEETAQTVAEGWGVPISLVKRWRLAVAGDDPNTLVAISIKKQDPKFRRRFYRRR